jgi:hypothetical protein
MGNTGTMRYEAHIHTLGEEPVHLAGWTSSRLILDTGVDKPGVFYTTRGQTFEVVKAKVDIARVLLRDQSITRVKIEETLYDEIS